MWLRPGRIVRVALIVAAIAGALCAPLWVPLSCMLALSVRYRAVEVPFIGLCVDLLWLPSVGWAHPLPLFTILGVALLWLFEPLRRELLL